MLLLGIVPERFGHSVITPVIKSYNKSFDDSSNYRPINIVPVEAKSFESVPVSFIDKYVTTHKNQFSFVKNGGCNIAVFSFDFTVKYFRNKHSNVYFCSLDATKAFDRTNYFYLLSCLCDHGLPFDLIQVFRSWLRNMKSCVSWGNECSQFFNVLSGIQQGSLLGPKFFNLVMDKL